MFETAKTVGFSFLGAGPQFSVDIPEEFDAVPEMTTPILNGFGGRNLVFIPGQRVEPMEDDNVLIDRLADRDGRPVEYYQRIPTPPLWRLKWDLLAGCLYTHLREEDPTEMVQTTLASLSIMESGPENLPYAAVYPPLAFGASQLPDYQERVLFTSEQVGEGATLYFQRPTELSDGDVLVPNGYAGLGVIRVGLGSDVEAEITLPATTAQCRAVADHVAESFAVA